MKYLSKHTIFISVFSLAILLIIVAANPAQADQKIIVVASTGWTGAIATAAGADEVRILAPLELKHPPEYDYRPSDIARLRSAHLLVYGGYEPFVAKLAQVAGFPPEKMIIIKTDNHPENLIKQTRLLAALMETKPKQMLWEKSFNKELADIQQQAQKIGLSGKKALVHKFQTPFVKWLGIDIIGVFGTEELSPRKLMTYAAMKPDIVIDNLHNPQGKPIAEIAGCAYAALSNFPSSETSSLIALLQKNAARLGIKDH